LNPEGSDERRSKTEREFPAPSWPRDRYEPLNLPKAWLWFTLACGVSVVLLIVGLIAYNSAFGVRSWDAVVAVVTAVAVVVFLGGLWITSRQTSDQLFQDRDLVLLQIRRAESERARAAVNEFVTVTTVVCKQIEDGSALISMCWLSAELLIDIAKRGLDTERDSASRRLQLKLQRLLKSDQGPLLSVWIRAAETSPSMSNLTAQAATLPSLAMRAEPWAAPIAAIASNLVRDVNNVFLSVFNHPEQRRAVVDLLAQEYLQSRNEADLVSGLAAAFNGNLSMYVTMRQYPNAARTIGRIVKLFAAGHNPARDDLVGDTHTADLRTLADSFFQDSPEAFVQDRSEATRDRVQNLIDLLELQITKRFFDPAAEIKFRLLKLKDVVDPNVDLYVSIFDEDPEAVKAALIAGANTDLTDREVLAAYVEVLAAYGLAVDAAEREDGSSDEDASRTD
jgi:hypothetical protein